MQTIGYKAAEALIPPVKGSKVKSKVPSTVSLRRATRREVVSAVLALSCTLCGPVAAQYNSIQRNIASYAQQNQLQSQINAARDAENRAMRARMQSDIDRQRNQPSIFGSLRVDRSSSPSGSSRSSSSQSPEVSAARRPESSDQVLLDEIGRKFASGGANALEYSYAGMHLLLGVERSRDEQLGIELLTTAANPKGLNWHYAQYLLGDLYLKGDLIKGDLQKAIDWYSTAAENGNINAQMLLVGSYLFGRGGFPTDPERALRFAALLETRLQATPASERPMELGRIKESGRGFDSQAQRREAALMVAYAELTAGRKSARARYWLDRAAQWGCNECVPLAAAMYFDAFNRNQQDDEAFFRNSKRAAEIGVPQGDFYLCHAYLEGVGTARDFKMGLNYCARAIDKGVHATNSVVGHALAEHASFDLAIEFFDNGAAAGNVDAITGKAMVLMDGRNAKRDPALGFKLLESVAMRSATAAYAMGVLYDAGEGVARDTKLSLRWMESAAERGDRQAQSRLAIWYTQGQRYAANPERAAYWAARLRQSGVDIDLAAFRPLPAPAQDYVLVLPVHGLQLAIPKEDGAWRAESTTVNGRQVQAVRRLSGYPQYYVQLDIRARPNCSTLMSQNRLEYGYEPVPIPSYGDWFLFGQALDRETTLFCRDVKGVGMLAVWAGHIGGDGVTAFKEIAPVVDRLASALKAR